MIVFPICIICNRMLIISTYKLASIRDNTSVRSDYIQFVEHLKLHGIDYEIGMEDDLFIYTNKDVVETDIRGIIQWRKHSNHNALSNLEEENKVYISR